MALKTSTLVNAKTHLSELVDAAERRGVSTIITKHGKPTAMIVPVPKTKKKRGMTPDEIVALHATFEGQGDPNKSAVEDLLASRR